MTNKEIGKIKQELKDINKKSFEERKAPLQKIAIYIGAHIPDSAPNNILHLYKYIHMALQTEMMFNACVCAKRSFFWAAIAATVAFVSVLVVLFLG